MRSANDTLSLGILSICINISLMLIKIGIGIAGDSYALIADGIESASDIFTSLITWAGFQYSLKPATKEFPYGFGKIESLAGMFSGFSLLGAGAFIAWQSIREIQTPHHPPAWYTLIVLIAVIVVKEYLSRRVFEVGNSLESTALKGDAWHHHSDAITSAAAALGIAIALIGGKGYETADDWAALAACSIIFVNGIIIVKASFFDVLDKTAPLEILAQISAHAAATPGVNRIEKCRVRKSGIVLFVEIHVQVNPSMSVAEGHRIGHEVKSRLIEGFPKISDVIVHLEPTAT